MKTKLTLLLIILSLRSFSQFQLSDTSFFPTYSPYSVTTPLIKYGQYLHGAAWNDPTLLKVGSQYIMYASASTGGLQNIKVKIYRLISNDGYSWTLNPSTPVLQPLTGTYYEGGTETPSVVYYKGMYHMYTTSYPQNVADQFVVAHAVSADGINWTMDAAPMIISDGGANWMGSIVGEPGAVVKDDTIYVFFTAAGLNGSAVEQTIGLVRSIDGSTIIDTTRAVKLPADAYPASANWWGLSTPSATMIGDTMYLFTDVAKSVNGRWYQAALQQFKSYGNLKKWYHDDVPIHTITDFNWTNGIGEYYSEIRSVTPLMDGNKLRIWYAGNRLADIVGTDTTYRLYFEGPQLHADSNYWGMSTSEYIFPTSTSITTNYEKDNDIQIVFNDKNVSISTTSSNECVANIYSITGQLLFRKQFYAVTEFALNYNGILLIQVITDEGISTKKIVAH